jgi:hypothetical protein
MDFLTWYSSVGKTARSILSPEQQSLLVVEFSKGDDIAPHSILAMVDYILHLYRQSQHAEDLSYREHKERLEQAATHADQLQKAIRKYEPEIESLFLLREGSNWAARPAQSNKAIDRIEAQLKEAQLKWSVFKYVLAVVASEADMASRGMGISAYVRLKSHAKDNIANRKKSRERRLIWEPILDLWEAYGHHVGFTDDGPLMRIISTIHTALSIDPPSPDSVRQAIRDFNKRTAKRGRLPNRPHMV